MAANVELVLLSAVARTGDYKAMTARGVSVEMFHDFPDEAQWVFDYIGQRRKAPSRMALKDAWPGITLYKEEDVDYYAEQVIKAHVREGVMSLIEEAVEAINSDDNNRVINVMQTGLMEVQKRTRMVSTDYDAFSDWGQTYNEVANRVDRVSKHGYAGIPSGFPTFDSVTGGFQPGWLSIVGARLGQGKTWTGIRMGFAAAAMQEVVQYWSLEQSRHQIAMRLHSFASQRHAKEVFNSLDLNRGVNFNLREYKKFLGTLKDAFGDGRFFINDSSRGLVTPMTIAQGIETNQPAIVFIDYLTLMGTSGEDWRATAKLSSELQGVAQRYMVPIVAMAQVNRLGIGKEPPGAENLSQADAIGQDADIVLTMAQKSKSVMKLRLAKNRHGPGDVRWHCQFQPGKGIYEEVSGDRAEELIEQDSEVD